MKKALFLILFTHITTNIYSSEQELKDEAIKILQENINFIRKYVIPPKEKKICELQQKQRKYSLIKQAQKQREYSLIQQEIDKEKQNIIAHEETIAKIKNNQPYPTSQRSNTPLVNGSTIRLSISKPETLKNSDLYDPMFFDQTGRKLATLQDRRNTKNDSYDSTTEEEKYIRDALFERNGVVCPAIPYKQTIIEKSMSFFFGSKKIIPIVVGTTDCNACDLLKKHFE